MEQRIKHSLFIRPYRYDLSEFGTLLVRLYFCFSFCFVAYCPISSARCFFSLILSVSLKAQFSCSPLTYSDCSCPLCLFSYTLIAMALSNGIPLPGGAHWLLSFCPWPWRFLLQCSPHLLCFLKPSSSLSLKSRLIFCFLPRYFVYSSTASSVTLS